MMKYLSDLAWWKQLSLNVGGVLTAFLSFLSILNIQYHWLTAGSINGIVTLIVAIGTLFAGSLATFANTYLTDSSKQKAALVANDYAIQQEAARQATLAELQAQLDQLKAQQAATTPSTDGPVEVTDTATK